MDSHYEEACQETQEVHSGGADYPRQHLYHQARAEEQAPRGDLAHQAGTPL